MSDVVFILGAGASVDCGGPLMFNFLDIATDLYKAGKISKEGQDHYARVFEIIGNLQEAHSKAQLDLNNIESIFTVFELGKIIQKLPGTPKNEIPQAIASLKEVIVRTLEAKIRFPFRDGRILAPNTYQAFAKLLKHIHDDSHPKTSVSVITFNYDIAIDVAMSNVGFQPNYRFEPKSGPIDLMKLHGSLNWATEIGEKKIIRPISMGDYLSKFNRIDGIPKSITIPIGSAHLGEYFRDHAPEKPIQVHPEPVIVPPSWNKADYHQALSNVWAAAAEHLSNAESIFVIGYSLPQTDSFFRHLYALGSVGKRPLRRFIVFDPDKEGGGVDQRFRSLLGSGAMTRYQYIEREFGPALEFIGSFFPK